MSSAVSVVLVTVPDVRVGRELGRQLVDEGLVACVNVVPGVRSIYRWQGKVEESDECLLVMKLRRAGVGPVRERVQALHPYDLPEVLALPVEDGSQPYLDWVVAESTPRGESSAT